MTVLLLAIILKYVFRIRFPANTYIKSFITTDNVLLSIRAIYHKSRETLGITTNLFDVICHMILIGSHFSEAARGGDRIHKGTESPHLVKLEYAVPTIRAM